MPPGLLEIYCLLRMPLRAIGKQKGVTHRLAVEIDVRLGHRSDVLKFSRYIGQRAETGLSPVLNPNLHWAHEIHVLTTNGKPTRTPVQQGAAAIRFSLCQPGVNA